MSLGCGGATVSVLAGGKPAIRSGQVPAANAVLTAKSFRINGYQAGRRKERKELFGLWLFTPRGAAAGPGHGPAKSLVLKQARQRFIFLASRNGNGYIGGGSVKTDE